LPKQPVTAILMRCGLKLYNEQTNLQYCTSMQHFLAFTNVEAE